MWPNEWSLLLVEQDPTLISYGIPQSSFFNILYPNNQVNVTSNPAPSSAFDHLIEFILNHFCCSSSDLDIEKNCWETSQKVKIYKAYSR
jgi:uncharacterized protein YggU (UPF0235/DUF167 family)